MHRNGAANDTSSNCTPAHGDSSTNHSSASRLAQKACESAQIGKFSFDKPPVLTGNWRNRGDSPHLNPLAMEACKHPRVRVLTREEDAEFVECLECGEVFDSHEFTDMDIEEKSQESTEESDE